MTEYRRMAEDIRNLLDLQTPPVAVAFLAEAPADIPRTSVVSPSACAFWRTAEQGVFYATAEQHFNCQIGAMVMGFNLPPDVNEQLGGLMESMCSVSYMAPEEAGSVPTVGGNPTGIAYGPLGDFPLVPHVVLLWLTPRQAMLYNEATGAASWTSQATRVGSRPGCAALPIAKESGVSTLTLGCAGMRTFTEIADDRLLAVVPGEKLSWFVDRLRVTAHANDEMLAYYRERKAGVSGT